MGREGNENYTRIILLLLEGGTFISREILKRETHKKEDNLNDLLRCHKEQLKRRFTEEQINEVLPTVGGARLDDWNIVLLTGVILELFRTTLTLREKRELLVIRNVRDELLSHVSDVSLDEDTFEDLSDQLEEALNTLSDGLEPALVVNCQGILDRYLNEPIHMPSSLGHLEDMCDIDDNFKNVAETLRNETKSVIDDIIGIVKKAQDDGRELKQPKVIEFVIQPRCKNKEMLECVDTALEEVTENYDRADDQENEYTKIKRALEDIFEEVKTICQVFTKYEKGKGAVFRIECTSYRILMDVVLYLESLQCLERLEEVAAVLRKHFGNENRLSLTSSFNEENMNSVYEAIRTENIEYSRSIALSMQANDVQGLVHIWDMFEGGGAQNQLNQLAEALSEYVGSKITITASVDKQKYKEAFKEAVRQTNQGEESQNTTVNDDDETRTGAQESNGNPEDNRQAADDENAIAPGRGCVSIVAVRPGKRRTILFDETISEGERDEISEMGFDTRVVRPGVTAVAPSSIEEVETETETESNTKKTENDTEETTLQGQESNNQKPKQCTIITDGDKESGERPTVIPVDAIQNKPNEEESENRSESVDIFYRNTALITSTKLDPSLTGPACVTRSVTSSVDQGKHVAPMKDQLELSVLLSSALANIGINQEVFALQQERIHKSESILNQMAKLSNRPVSVFHFGSEAEGTTLRCEHTHVETMVILDEYSVIQNTFSLKQPSTIKNIILAEDTRPGYVHLPLTDEMFGDIVNESSLICAVKSNNKCSNAKDVHCGFGANTVLALRMSAWPIELKRSIKQRAETWVFETSGEDLLRNPLTVVPFMSNNYRKVDMEWRISTVHVERVLMTSLNIYQQRVFFLFRAVIRYLVNPYISKPLTSYIIKNIFLHMASATWPDLWNDTTIVWCLIGCLDKTRQFIRATVLPNFLIPRENLIFGILKPDDRNCADDILLQICSRPLQSIAQIKEGYFGKVLNIQKDVLLDQIHIYTTDGVSSYWLNKYESCIQIVAYKDFLLEQIVERSSDESSAVENHLDILRFLNIHKSKIEHVNSCLVATIAYQYISTSLASHLVCLALKTENPTERDWYLCTATMFFSRGMESDALSSRVKFITALIALGHLSSAREMMVEMEISEQIMNSQAVCSCRRKTHAVDTSHDPCRKSRKERLMEDMCTCVTFLHTESLVTPLAMKYEMYRSASKSVKSLDSSDLRILKWGVVDAKVYFGFLNTLLYSTIEDIEVYVGSPDVHHNETLMNFLGMWSEFIGDYNNADVYYKESLRRCPEQNVVKWHICLLLFRQWLCKTVRQIVE